MQVRFKDVVDFQPSGVKTPRISAATTSALERVKSKPFSVQSSVPAKLIQSTQEYGLLAAVQGIHLALIGTTVTSVFSVDRNSGPVTQEIQQRETGISHAASTFKHKNRAQILDRGSNNLPADTSLIGGRGVGWSGSPVDCRAHGTATIVQQSFHEMMKAETKGLYYLPLSLSHGPAMRRWRKCILDDALERVRLCTGVASPEATRYRQHMMRLFLGTAANKEEKQLLLIMLPNGDWRKDVIDVHLPADVDVRAVDRNTIAHVVGQGIVRAMAMSQYHKLKLQKWQGLELPVGEFGILGAVCNVLSHAYVRFAAEYGIKASLLETVLLRGGPDFGDDALEECELEKLETDDEEEAGHDQQHEDGTKNGHDGENPAQEWLKKNAKDRRESIRFLATRPHGKMIIFGQYSEPLRELQHAEFEMSTTTWETEQRARMAAAIAASRTDIHARQYRPLVLADLQLESKFFKKMQYLNTMKSMRDCVPNTCLDVGARALGFRLSSRLCCSVFLSKVMTGTTFPLRAFRCLRGASHLWEIKCWFAVVPLRVHGPITSVSIRK